MLKMKLIDLSISFLIIKRNLLVWTYFTGDGNDESFLFFLPMLNCPTLDNNERNTF